MSAYAKFVLVKSGGKELLINVSQIESIQAIDDPTLCEIHMIGDDEESFFFANHTMQDLVAVLDEAADVFIAEVGAQPEGTTEIASIATKENT